MAFVSVPQRLILLLGWLCLSLTAVAQPAPSHTSAADLRYGVALYHFYQNEHLQALSELQVAQARDGIQGHGDNPEIMVGGFLLAYGMERQVGEIFERLLADNRSRHTQDRAWYYLARLRYLRGDWAGSVQALERVQERPSGEVAADVQALKVNLAIAQQDLPRAQALLSSRALRNSEDLPYLNHNLGAAFSRAGLHEQGLRYLKRSAHARLPGEEHQALRDQALTAAGYAHLLQQEYSQAIEQFVQVRTHSPLSQRALLGYGWAEIAQQNFAGALKPWQVLAARPLIDENTQEARVAIPYAYQRMGYSDLALTHFRRAEMGFEEEIARLDRVVEQLQGHALRSALNIEMSQGVDWLTYAEQNTLAPELTYLVRLFAQERFVSHVQELRDLLAIEANLRQWTEKLQLYNTMLDEREANRAREMDVLAQQQLDDQIGQLQSQRHQLAQTLAQLRREPDYLALAGLDQAPKIVRIKRAERNLEILQSARQQLGRDVMPEEELAKLALFVRVHRGRITWDSAEMYPQRLAQAQSALEQLDQQLAQAQAARARIQLIVDQGFDLQPYRLQIVAAQEQIVSQQVDLERTLEQAQDRLRALVEEALQQQRTRLVGHLTQARWSIARLLDQAQALSSKEEAGS